MPVRFAGYEIDIAEEEEHSFENEVSDFPVETGASIVDHVRSKPVTLRINGLVSDTPLGSLAARRDEFTQVGGEAFQLHSDEAFARLFEIYETREPIEVETPRRVYKDMVLETLSVPFDARTGFSLRFSATFRQVRLVTNERVTVRVKIKAAKAVVRGQSFAPDVVPSAPSTSNAKALAESYGVTR